MLFFPSFQCEHEDGIGDQATLHMISHKLGRSSENLLQYCTEFFDTHLDWITTVGAQYVHARGLTVYQYLSDFVQGKRKVDSLMLLIIARIYHTHIGVVLKDKYWTTHVDNELSRCKIVLVYRGGGDFWNTYTVTEDSVVPGIIINDQQVIGTVVVVKKEPEDIPEVQHSNDIESTRRVPIDVNVVIQQHGLPVKRQTNVQATPQQLENPVPKPSLKRVFDSFVVLEKIVVPVKKRKVSNFSANAGKLFTPVKQTETNVIPKKAANKRVIQRVKSTPVTKKIAVKQQSVQNVNKCPKMFITKPATKYYAASTVPKDTKSDIVSSKEVVKPRRSKKSTSVRKAASTVPKVAKTDIVSSKEVVKPRRSKRSTSVRKATSTVTKVTKDSNQKVDNFKICCPVCDTGFNFLKDCDDHVSKKHKRFVYKCIYCVKKFHNRILKERHEESHKTAQHACEDCGKQFQFLYMLTEHQKVHTGDSLFQCTICKKKYTTKRALVLHDEIHQGKKYTCKVRGCNYYTNRKQNLDQHTKGKHGEGWPSPCGVKFEWKPKMLRHRSSCKACKKVLKTNEQKKIMIAKKADKELS